MSGSKTAVKLAMLAAVVMAACVSMTSAHAVTIDWVTVGNAGNAADTTGFGAVNYDYKIGKYAVTIGQYTDFLNAAAKSDPYGLYFTEMQTDPQNGGISRTGSSGSYNYSVIGNRDDQPITFVSWFDAARFANWMQNGQGTGSTETGAYELNGAASGNAVARNSGATVYIPTENEWYKAAYFSPVKGGVGSPGYYKYATQSDTNPGNVVGNAPNQANYFNGVWSVTQSPGYVGSQNYRTDVGAFTNSASYYGTFDQSGNVYQWNDLDGTAGSFRGRRGGTWSSNATVMSSSARFTYNTSDMSYDVGFRLASVVNAVPEPATYVMALAGVACGGFSMWLRRMRA